eukprot:m.199058 g.199058  ORF g.199058 m.199058 type:complete len:451 (+) comp21892_c0_seq5:1297-2649(+)
MSSFLKGVKRQQEKLKQKLNKEETEDELAEDITNFQIHQKQAERLHRDTASYAKALKGLADAAKQLGESIKAVYDPSLSHSDEVYTAVESLVLLHQDADERLTDQVVTPLASYLQRFPEMKNRISKRERKQLDYSAAKRTLDHAKEKGSTKMQQLEEAFQEAEKTFLTVDADVKDALPAFIAQRSAYYAAILHSMYNTEVTYHSSCAQLATKLQEYVSATAEDKSIVTGISQPITTRTMSIGGRLVPKPDTTGPSPLGTTPPSAAAAAASVSAVAAASSSSGSSGFGTAPVPRPRPAPANASATPANAEIDESSTDEPPAVVAQVVENADSSPSQEEATVDNEARPNAGLADDGSSPRMDGSDPAAVLATAVEEVQQERKLAPDVIELRVATHAYDGEDEDELTFSKGDTIEVIPFVNSDDEEEEGWLNGRIGMAVGLFPANFTVLLKTG